MSPMLGKLEMPNRVRAPVAPGMALVGDAALATDPLFGVGCGWALQSGEWLADSVASALRGHEPLERGLARYRRRHARELRGHMFFIHDYATGRRFNPGERLLFAGGARDVKLAATLDAFATRRAGPARTFASALPRAIAVYALHLLGRRRDGDIPALVIWGEHDAYLPAAFATRQRKAFPSAEVHVLPASGHWPYVDAADTVERLLVEFLGRVSSPAPSG